MKTLVQPLDVCSHDKCDKCGGVEIGHENWRTIWIDEYRSEDIENGECNGGEDDVICEGHEDEDLSPAEIQRQELKEQIEKTVNMKLNGSLPF